MFKVIFVFAMLLNVSAYAFDTIECSGPNSRVNIKEGKHDGYSAPIQISWIVDLEEHEGFSLGCSPATTKTIPGASTIYCTSNSGRAGYIFIPNSSASTFSLQVQWDTGVSGNIQNCRRLK